MTLLTIGDETFRVDVEGDATKPALLLSNSLGTDLSMWDGQVAELAKHFRVIRYDPRGHGGSVVGEAPASLDRLGRDALGILDALEVETAHVVGLSMGGAVAIWLLVNAPERIGRAVLANTAARFGSAETWNARITSVLGDGMAKNAAATMERWFSPEFSARAPDRVEAIHAVLRDTSPQGYAHSCAALRDMDMRARLGAIDRDVLVVTGRDDPVVSDEDTRVLVEGIAGAEHVVLAARHASNVEAQADFNAVVAGFLTRPSRKAPKRSLASRKKTAPMKRGGAARRSNAARSPLDKAPAERTAAKRAPAKKRTAKKAVRSATKTAAAHRRPTVKRGTTRRAASKTATKRPVKKTAARKATRRPTPTSTARGAVAKKPTKRPAGTAASKTAASKTAASKTAANKVAAKKTAARKAAAKTTKKLPTARRKPAGKPRRPTGRGKR